MLILVVKEKPTVFAPVKGEFIMGFDRKSILWTYDIFPKVFVVNEKASITVRNIGERVIFADGKDYKVAVTWLPGGSAKDHKYSGYKKEIVAKGNKDGGFNFDFSFPYEGEYYIAAYGIKSDGSEKKIVLPVYAVESDLKGRYPFMGDLHMHTCLSDGAHTPEFVASSYRAHGYDFLAITDHNRYYPSLRAINSFKNLPTEYALIPGEEVHMPDVYDTHVSPHTVNFGGEYSINALVEGIQTGEVGTDKSTRSLNGVCPDVMTREEFSAKMTALSKEIKVPENVDPVVAATLKWIYDEIRKANGLAIFAHPGWITGDVFHVPDAVNDWLVENELFDAFEVLGGENYFEQNGFQTIRYYEDIARGHKYPIVGSTDSHNCTVENRNGFICSTIVFSPENERTALVKSIKDFKSVAVDTISKEFRIVGEMRYVRYACFLLKNYFPLHDDLCFDEGKLLHMATCGTEDEKRDAVAVLNVTKDKFRKQREKYFAFR